MTEPWQEADQRVARLRLDRFSAAVDAWNPAGGLCDVQIDGRAFPTFHTLGVDLPVAPTQVAVQGVESYARSGDLVVTYSEQPAPAMRTQIYWRATAHERRGAIAAITLVVSVQTSLLESCPTLSVSSQLVASEALQLIDAERGTFTAIVPSFECSTADDACCYLFRLPGRQYSYVEMIHPSDQRHSSWEGWLHAGDYRLQLRHELFTSPLEKGVILRARVLGVLVDRRDDKAAAVAHWAAFLRDELPLTT